MNDAPGVGGDVLAPARHGEALPAAVAAAGIGQHDGVRPVRQEVGARAERVRRHVAAHQQRRQPPRRRDVLGLLNRRVLQRNEVRDPFLQQQLGRLHPRIGVKAVLHRRAVDRVVERDQAHALVVRHVGGQRHAAGVVLRQPIDGVVDRLVEAVLPLEPGGAKALEIGEHRRRHRAAPRGSSRTGR